MEHEDGAGVPGSHLQEQPQSRGVEYEAEDKDQTVGHGQEDVFEVLVKATPVVDGGGVAPVQNNLRRFHRDVSAQERGIYPENGANAVYSINTYELT